MRYLPADQTAANKTKEFNEICRLHHTRAKYSMKLYRIISIVFALFILHTESPAFRFNSFGREFYTIESKHFKAHYTEGLQQVAERALVIAERLYDTYENKYHIKLPKKTDMLVVNSQFGNGWAIDLINTFLISSNAFDYNLRGTHDWLEDVVAHEYAHIVSISAAHKLPKGIAYLQFGTFSHPNEKNRAEMFHIYPQEVLPPWFFEGIAQYESALHGSDRWDTHRDMIVRTLTLSNKLLSWDHMSVFAGRGDDYEKTYNHGFSLVKYISEQYGHEKIVSILRESGKITRFNFDHSIKAVLGISGRELYREWKQHLETKYDRQLEKIGKQVYGVKLNESGFDNYWPRFSPDEMKVYFISNGESHYSFTSLYSYSFVDTLDDDKRNKQETGKIRGFYSIHDASGSIIYASAKSRASQVPMEQGGIRKLDLYIDTLPPAKKQWNPFKKKTTRQITFKKGLFHASLSPDAKTIACSRHDADRFYVCLLDTSGENLRIAYPDTSDPTQVMTRIFSIDWCSDGRTIAVDYMDQHDRKIGIFDTLSGDFTVVCNTEHDEREPRFSQDGNSLYFSSDRTGIFNVYRYCFETGALQRLTNVSGGAFAPDPSRDETELVYANYDENGYAIYYIDSIVPVEEFEFDPSFMVTRAGKPREPVRLPISAPKNYSFLPRKLFLMPTFLNEEIVTDDNDVFSGKSTFKMGLVFQLLDPFAFADYTGNFLGGYFMVDALKWYRIINFDKGLISPKVDYDLGFFSESNMLPTPVRFNYAQRGITGRDKFYDQTEERLRFLPYNVTPMYGELLVPFYLRRGSMLGGGASSISINPFASLSKTDVTLLLEEEGFTFHYNISKNARIGAFAAMLNNIIEPTMNISPRGHYVKAFYAHNTENLIDDENAFNESLQENYQTYQFHNVRGNVKMGMPLPWSKKHAFYFDIGGEAVEIHQTSGTESSAFPYYFEPVIWWHPGYAYYVQDTLERYDPERSSPGRDFYDTLPYLRGIVAGNMITFGKFSYRFPLWPKTIDKKLAFFYFEHLYGAANFTAAGGWQTFDEIKNATFDDWLYSYGAELRLEGQTFNRYPLALKLRWEHGFNKEIPGFDLSSNEVNRIGGHRVSFSLGFAFDDWGLIEVPDYHRPGSGFAGRHTQ
ncbi:MAG: hypothetical protein GF398_05485 [Chitinivibrionales bacterium]|nr:hypothetical protein [Chitinivibrionales bacterium]